MTPQRIDTGYRPRSYQRDIHRRLRRFSVLVLHRRAGKTVLAVNALVDAALRGGKQNARYAYLAPFLKQAKQIAWDYLRQYTADIPGVVINEAELQVTLSNGARIRLYGADNPDALRGLYLDGVVLDEVADMKPQVWGEVVRPALADRKGWALFIGTPRGLNQFHDLFTFAMSGVDPDWYAALYTVDDTGAIDWTELEAAKATMSDAQYRQEFLCDWQAANDDVLIPIDLVSAAARRNVHPADVAGMPVILGVDVARFGGDSSCIVVRQGLLCRSVWARQGLGNMDLADRVQWTIEQEKAMTVFVDAGRGEGVIDRLRQLGHRSVVEVNFGGTPRNPRFANRRSEMWQGVADWLKAGGVIPDHQGLRRDLSTPTYGFTPSGQMILERKDKIRERGLPSPDHGDALALTFAAPVVPIGVGRAQLVARDLDYNPYQ